MVAEAVVYIRGGETGPGKKKAEICLLAMWMVRKELHLRNKAGLSFAKSVPQSDLQRLP